MKIKKNYFLIVLCLCVATSVHAEEIICEVDRPSIVERIVNRSYPSVFTTWQWGIENDPQSPNESHWSYQKRSVSRRDLFWQGSFRAQVYFQYLTPEGSHLVFRGGGDPEYADEIVDQRNQIQALNPDFLFLASFHHYSAHPSDHYPKDWKYWLRDKEGNRIRDGDYGEMLIDYTLPGAEDHFVQMAVSVAKCGIFDGIFMDLWAEEESEFPGPEGTTHLYHGSRVEAIVSLVKRIREAVGDDFLIIVNTRTLKIPRSAPYVNGAFIETFDKAYPRERLIEFENALSWYEDNLRYPQVNCLNITKSRSEPWDSPANRQLVRATTTLSLTHSNGYINLTANYNSEQYWYPFWDAPLGGPLGGDETKGVLYENREGVFIREFTNGWAVYNRSGKEQEIELPQEVSGWSSGVENQRSHLLPDLDGEIYLKTVVQVAPGEYPPLYWINAKIGTLQRLVNTEVKNLVSGTQNATSLTVDAANGKLYWTEKTGNRTGKIQSANLDGTNIQLVKDLTSAPLDLTLDTAGGKLYLSNAWGKIQRMNLDGSNFQPNLITDLKSPQNLVLDTTNSKIYWTEQTSQTTGKIQRANLDGSNVQLVKELTSAPRGMAFDAVNMKLYLTNAWGKLQRMDPDGSNFQPNFITGLASPGQVAVDRVGGKVYWTEKGKLRHADLNGGDIQDVITGLGELADIGLGIDAVGEMGVAAAPMITPVVEQTQLLANYPNPFNPETWIPYQLSEPAEVTVRIYSVNGILVRTLALGQTSAGIYQNRNRAAYWDGRNDVGESVASGIYFYTFTAGDFTATRKLLIRK